MQTTRRSLSSVAALLVTAGCFPITAHPTRIEPGMALTAGMAAQVVRDSSASRGRHDAILPSWALGFSAGFVDSLNDGIGSRLAGGVGLASFFADAYFEAPRSAFGDWDAGAGISWQWVAAPALIPYVQVGREIGRNVQAQGSIGLAFLGHDSLPNARRVAVTLSFSTRGEGSTALGRGASQTTFITLLPGAERRWSESHCFLLCARDDGPLGSTTLIIGTSIELRLAPREGRIPGPGLPPHR
jgi:hypothetical protein